MSEDSELDVAEFVFEIGGTAVDWDGAEGEGLVATGKGAGDPEVVRARAEGGS